ncbi:unnamed protein product [Blepharisma stoltei]|uniref:Uncharacterized protein n=1 Tax=Blepharisma stoltei TaxID=1481888 RepID=A0AAU9KCR1_9CILI|nr:unnamed protein product [Blepharisma stoltei]
MPRGWFDSAEFSISSSPKFGMRGLKGGNSGAACCWRLLEFMLGFDINILQLAFWLVKKWTKNSVGFSNKLKYGIAKA